MAQNKLQISILKLKEVCRTCSQKGDLRSIFDDEEGDDNILGMLVEVADVKVAEDDGLPQNICTACIAKLKVAHEFKKQCERLYVRFKSFANSEFEPIIIDSIVKIDADVEYVSYDAPEDGVDEMQAVVDEDGEDCAVVDGDGDNCTVEVVSDTEDGRESDMLRNMCRLCGEVFERRAALITHLEVHNIKMVAVDGKEYECAHCEACFDRVAELKVHLSVAHGAELVMDPDDNGELLHVCVVCYRTFPSKHGLSIHQAFHANERLDASVEKPFMCTVCEKTFASLKAMRNHKKTHGNKRYACSICQKSFSIKARLQIHIRTHTGEKPYSCPDCGKRFANTTSLRIHDLIHSGARPHYCKVCDRRFKQHSHLKNHLLTHSGVRPFECVVCGKTFVFKGNLTVHMRMHSGETPYRCPVCDKGFYDSSRMKKHHKTHNKQAT